MGGIVRTWILFILLVSCVLAGCVTLGHRFDSRRVDELVPVFSTSQEALELLGEPSAESSYADGSRLLQWHYVQGTPIGGSGAHVAILFDSDGVMIRVTHRWKT